LFSYLELRALPEFALLVLALASSEDRRPNFLKREYSL
jgi:hypothetical protein